MTNFQRKTLRKSDTSIKTFDDIKLPIFVEEFLSYGPKHPIKDKLNELHFLANVDKLVRNLRANELEGEKLCEKEVSAKWYARNIRVMKYLKENALFAEPYDEGNGFCVMRRQTYDRTHYRRFGIANSLQKSKMALIV